MLNCSSPIMGSGSSKARAWTRGVSLIDAIKEKLEKTISEFNIFEKTEKDIDNCLKEIDLLSNEIDKLYIFGSDQEEAERNCQTLVKKTEGLSSHIKNLIANTKDYYLKSQEILPSDLQKALTDLELNMERLVQSMDDKERQQKRARTVRSEYSNDLDILTNWIQKAEIKVRDKTSQPQVLKQSLQEIQSELPSMSERLDKLILNANTICENCQDADEVALIRGNINTLSEQLNTIKSWLDEKKQLNALLHETSEEWEQCEKKLREVRSWYEKTKGALDAGAGKKKPLRDQLAAKEKIMADVSVQKTKISVSVEKLQVHFKCGLQGGESVVEAAEKLKHELESLHGIVKQQSVELEAAIDQVEQYQQELLYLKQEVITSEQKLRTISSPAYLPHDRETAAREQNALKNSILETRDKIRELMVLLQKRDPFGTKKTELGFMSKLETIKLITDSCSYADIAAGRATSPARFDGSPVSKTKIQTNDSSDISYTSETTEILKSNYSESPLTTPAPQIVTDKDTSVPRRLSRLDQFQLHIKQPPAIVVNDEKTDEPNEKYSLSSQDKETLPLESMKEKLLISETSEGRSQSPAKIDNRQVTEIFLSNESKISRSKSPTDGKCAKQGFSHTKLPSNDSVQASFYISKFNKLNRGTRSQGSSVSRDDRQKLSLLTIESTRCRSKSPVWIPGESASYSDIVKGNSRSSSRIPSLEDLTLTGSSSFESGFDTTTKNEKSDSKNNIKLENEMKKLLVDDNKQEVSDGYFIKVSSVHGKHSSIDDIIKECTLDDIDRSNTISNPSDLGSFRKEKIIKITKKILKEPVSISNEENKMENLPSNISNQIEFKQEDKSYLEGPSGPATLFDIGRKIESRVERNLEAPLSLPVFILNEQQTNASEEEALLQVSPPNEKSYKSVEITNSTERSLSPSRLIVGREKANLSLLTVESKRSRSKSPIWIPGETASYSDIVKGNSRNSSRVPSLEDLTSTDETELKLKNVTSSALNYSQKRNRKKTNTYGLSLKDYSSTSEEFKSVENINKKNINELSIQNKESPLGEQILDKKENETIAEVLTIEKSKEPKTENISSATTENLDSFQTSNDETNLKKNKKNKKKLISSSSGTTIVQDKNDEVLSSAIVDSAPFDDSDKTGNSKLMELSKSAEICIQTDKKKKSKKQKQNISADSIESSPKYISSKDETNVAVVDEKTEIEETPAFITTCSVHSFETLGTDPNNVEYHKDQSSGTIVKSERKKKTKKNKQPEVLSENLSVSKEGSVEKEEAEVKPHQRVETELVKEKQSRIPTRSVPSFEKSEIDSDTVNLQQHADTVQGRVTNETTIKVEKKKKSKKPKLPEVSDNNEVVPRKEDSEIKQEIDIIPSNNVVEAQINEKTLGEDTPSDGQTCSTKTFGKLEIDTVDANLPEVLNTAESSGTPLTKVKGNKKNKSKKAKLPEVSDNNEVVSRKEDSAKLETEVSSAEKMEVALDMKEAVPDENLETKFDQVIPVKETPSVDQTCSTTKHEKSEIATQATNLMEIPDSTQSSKSIGIMDKSERKKKSKKPKPSGVSEKTKEISEKEHSDVKPDMKFISAEVKVDERTEPDNVDIQEIPVMIQDTNDSLNPKDNKKKKSKKLKWPKAAPDNKAVSEEYSQKSKTEVSPAEKIETNVDLEISIEETPSVDETSSDTNLKKSENVTPVASFVEILDTLQDNQNIEVKDKNGRKNKSKKPKPSGVAEETKEISGKEDSDVKPDNVDTQEIPVTIQDTDGSSDVKDDKKKKSKKLKLPKLTPDNEAVSEEYSPVKSETEMNSAEKIEVEVDIKEFVKENIPDENVETNVDLEISVKEASPVDETSSNTNLEKSENDTQVVSFVEILDTPQDSKNIEVKDRSGRKKKSKKPKPSEVSEDTKEIFGKEYSAIKSDLKFISAEAKVDEKTKPDNVDTQEIPVKIQNTDGSFNIKDDKKKKSKKLKLPKAAPVNKAVSEEYSLVKSETEISSTEKIEEEFDVKEAVKETIPDENVEIKVDVDISIKETHSVDETSSNTNLEKLENATPVANFVEILDTPQDSNNIEVKERSGRKKKSKKPKPTGVAEETKEISGKEDPDVKPDIKLISAEAKIDEGTEPDSVDIQDKSVTIQNTDDSLDSRDDKKNKSKKHKLTKATPDSKVFSEEYSSPNLEAQVSSTEKIEVEVDTKETVKEVAAIPGENVEIEFEVVTHYPTGSVNSEKIEDQGSVNVQEIIDDTIQNIETIRAPVKSERKKKSKKQKPKVISESSGLIQKGYSIIKESTEIKPDDIAVKGVNESEVNTDHIKVYSKESDNEETWEITEKIGTTDIGDGKYSFENYEVDSNTIIKLEHINEFETQKFEEHNIEADNTKSVFEEDSDNKIIEQNIPTLDKPSVECSETSTKGKKKKAKKLTLAEVSPDSTKVPLQADYVIKEEADIRSGYDVGAKGDEETVIEEIPSLDSGASIKVFQEIPDTVQSSVSIETTVKSERRNKSKKLKLPTVSSSNVDSFDKPKTEITHGENLETNVEKTGVDEVLSLDPIVDKLEIDRGVINIQEMPAIPISSESFDNIVIKSDTTLSVGINDFVPEISKSHVDIKENVSDLEESMNLNPCSELTEYEITFETKNIESNLGGSLEENITQGMLEFSGKGKKKKKPKIIDEESKQKPNSLQESYSEVGSLQEKTDIQFPSGKDISNITSTTASNLLSNEDKDLGKHQEKSLLTSFNINYGSANKESFEIPSNIMFNTENISMSNSDPSGLNTSAYFSNVDDSSTISGYDVSKMTGGEELEFGNDTKDDLEPLLREIHAVVGNYSNPDNSFLGSETEKNLDSQQFKPIFSSKKSLFSEGTSKDFIETRPVLKTEDVIQATSILIGKEMDSFNEVDLSKEKVIALGDTVHGLYEYENSDLPTETKLKSEIVHKENEWSILQSSEVDINKVHYNIGHIEQSELSEPVINKEMIGEKLITVSNNNQFIEKSRSFKEPIEKDTIQESITITDLSSRDIPQDDISFGTEAEAENISNKSEIIEKEEKIQKYSSTDINQGEEVIVHVNQPKTIHYSERTETPIKSERKKKSKKNKLPDVLFETVTITKEDSVVKRETDVMLVKKTGEETIVEETLPNISTSSIKSVREIEPDSADQQNPDLIHSSEIIETTLKSKKKRKSRKPKLPLGSSEDLTISKEDPVEKIESGVIPAEYVDVTVIKETVVEEKPSDYPVCSVKRSEKLETAPDNIQEIPDAILSTETVPAVVKSGRKNKSKQNKLPEVLSQHLTVFKEDSIEKTKPGVIPCEPVDTEVIKETVMEEVSSDYPVSSVQSSEKSEKAPESIEETPDVIQNTETIQTIVKSGKKNKSKQNKLPKVLSENKIVSKEDSVDKSKTEVVPQGKMETKDKVKETFEEEALSLSNYPTGSLKSLEKSEIEPIKVKFEGISGTNQSRESSPTILKVNKKNKSKKHKIPGISTDTITVSGEDSVEKTETDVIPSSMEAKDDLKETVEEKTLPIPNYPIDSIKSFEKSEIDSFEVNLEDINTNENKETSSASLKANKKKKSKKHKIPIVSADPSAVPEEDYIEKLEYGVVTSKNVEEGHADYPPENSETDPNHVIFQDITGTIKSRATTEKVKKKKQSKKPKQSEISSDNEGGSENEDSHEKTETAVSSENIEVEVVKDTVEVEALSDYPSSSALCVEEIEDPGSINLQEITDSIQTESIKPPVKSERKKKAKKQKPQISSDSSEIIKKDNSVTKENKEIIPDDNTFKSMIESEVNTDHIKVYSKESDNEETSEITENIGTTDIGEATFYNNEHKILPDSEIVQPCNECNYDAGSNTIIRLDNTNEFETQKFKELDNVIDSTGKNNEASIDGKMIEQYAPTLERTSVESSETSIKGKKKKARKHKVVVVSNDDVPTPHKEEADIRIGLELETKAVDETVGEEKSPLQSTGSVISIGKSKTDPDSSNIQEMSSSISFDDTFNKISSVDLSDSHPEPSNTIVNIKEDLDVRDMEEGMNLNPCSELTEYEVTFETKDFESNRAVSLQENISQEIEVSVKGKKKKKSKKPKVNDEAPKVNDEAPKINDEPPKPISLQKTYAEVSSLEFTSGKSEGEVCVTEQKKYSEGNKNSGIDESCKNFGMIESETKSVDKVDSNFYYKDKPKSNESSSIIFDVVNKHSSVKDDNSVTTPQSPEEINLKCVIEDGLSNIIEKDKLSEVKGNDFINSSYETLSPSSDAISHNISSSCLAQPGLLSDDIAPSASADPYFCNKMGAHEVVTVPPSAGISKSSPELSNVSDGQQVSAEKAENVETSPNNLSKPLDPEEFMNTLHKSLEKDKSHLLFKESYAEVVKRSRDPSPAPFHKHAADNCDQPVASGSSFIYSHSNVIPDKQDGQTTAHVLVTKSEADYCPQIVFEPFSSLKTENVSDSTADTAPSIFVNEYNVEPKIAESFPISSLHNINLTDNNTVFTYDDSSPSGNVFINPSLQPSSDSLPHDVSQIKELNFIRKTNIDPSYTLESKLFKQESNSDVKSHDIDPFKEKLYESFPSTYRVLESYAEVTKRSRESSPAKALMNPACKSATNQIDPPSEPFPVIGGTLTQKGDPHSCLSSPEELQSDLQKESMTTEDVIPEEEIEVVQESVTPEKEEIMKTNYSEKETSINNIDKEIMPEEPLTENGMNTQDKTMEFLKHEVEMNLEPKLEENVVEILKPQIPSISEQILKTQEKEYPDPIPTEPKPSSQSHPEKKLTSTLPTPLASVETTSSQEDYTIENVEVNIGIGFSQSDSLDETNKTDDVVAEFAISSDDNLSHTQDTDSFETENVSDVHSEDVEVSKPQDPEKVAVKIVDSTTSKKSGKKKKLKKETHIDVPSPEKDLNVVVDTDKKIIISPPETFQSEDDKNTVIIATDDSYKIPTEPDNIIDLVPSEQMKDQMIAQTFSTGGIVESFESYSNVEQEGTSSHMHATIVQPVIHQVRRSRKIIRKVVIIDGKEHVSETVIEEPEQIISSTLEQDQVPMSEEFSGSFKRLSYSEVNTSRQVVMHSRKRITKTVKMVNGKVLVEETETTPDEMEIVTVEEPTVSIVQYDEQKGDSEEFRERPIIVEVPEETTEEKHVPLLVHDEEKIIPSEKAAGDDPKESPKTNVNIVEEETIDDTSVSGDLPITEPLTVVQEEVSHITSPILTSEQDSNVDTTKNAIGIVHIEQKEPMISSTSHISSEKTEKPKEKVVPSKSLSLGSESSDSCYADIQVKVSVPEEISLSVGIKKPKGKKKAKDIKKKAKEMKNDDKHISEPSLDTLNNAAVQDQKNELGDNGNHHLGRMAGDSRSMTAQFLESEMINYDAPEIIKQDRSEPGIEKIDKPDLSTSSSSIPHTSEISPNKDELNQKQEETIQSEKIMESTEPFEEVTPSVSKIDIQKPRVVDIDIKTNKNEGSGKIKVGEQIVTTEQNPDSELFSDRTTEPSVLSENEKQPELLNVFSSEKEKAIQDIDPAIISISPVMKEDDKISIKPDSSDLPSVNVTTKDPGLTTEETYLITQIESKPEKIIRTNVTTIQLQKQPSEIEHAQLTKKPLEETIKVSTTPASKKGKKSKKGSKTVEKAEPKKDISETTRDISIVEDKISSDNIIMEEVTKDQLKSPEKISELTSDHSGKPSSTEVGSKGKQNKKRKAKKNGSDVIGVKLEKDVPSSLPQENLSKSESPISSSKLPVTPAEGDSKILESDRKDGFSDDTQVRYEMNKEIPNDDIDFTAPLSSQKISSLEIIDQSAGTSDNNADPVKLQEIPSSNKEAATHERSALSPKETNYQLQVTTFVETEQGRPIVNVVKSSLNDLSTSLIFEDNVVNVSVTTEDEKVNANKEISERPKIDVSLTSDSSIISSDLNDTVIEMKSDVQPETNVKTPIENIVCASSTDYNPNLISGNEDIPKLSTTISDGSSYISHDPQRVEFKDEDVRGTCSVGKVSSKTPISSDSSPSDATCTYGPRGTVIENIPGDHPVGDLKEKDETVEAIEISIHVKPDDEKLMSVMKKVKQPKLKESDFVTNERDQLVEVKPNVHAEIFEEKIESIEEVSELPVVSDYDIITKEDSKPFETDVSEPSELTIISDKQKSGVKPIKGDQSNIDFISKINYGEEGISSKQVSVPLKSESQIPYDMISLSYSLQDVVVERKPDTTSKEIENVEDLTIKTSETPIPTYTPLDSDNTHDFLVKEIDSKRSGDAKELEDTDHSEFVIVDFPSTSDNQKVVTSKEAQENDGTITSDKMEPKYIDYSEKTLEKDDEIKEEKDSNKESELYSSKTPDGECSKSSKEISDDLLQTIKERIVNVNTPSFVGLLSDLDNTVRRKEMNYNLDLLKNTSEEEKESVIVTTIILISEYLETITYIIINSKKYDRDASNLDEKLQQVSLLLNDLNMLKDGIACLRANGGDKELLNALESQADGVTNILDSTGANVNSKAIEREEILKKSKDILSLIQNLSEDIENLEKDQSIPAEKKLKKLDKLEVLNADYETQVSLLLKKYPTQGDLINASQLLFANDELLSGLRVSLVQSQALAQEYQDTLVELENVSEVAKTIVASRVIVPSLQDLQNEMQKERKFFISLSHCRSILESLESSLDEETRTANAKIHSRIHNIASEVLESAGERAVALALGASRWTLLEQGLAEERGWLRVAQERVPNLSGVSTSDYYQYLSLYQSLMNDIELHSAKVWKLLETAHTLQGLISCGGLEESCEALRSNVANLEEQVSDNVRKLTEFKDIWIGYENNFHKLDRWLDIVIKNYVPPLDIQSFWELKAEHEVQKTAYSDLCARFDNAMKILPVTDESKQADNLKELSHKWDIVNNRLEEVEVAIPSDLSSGERLEIIEARLKQMEDSLNNYHDISNEEELDLYVGKLQVLKEGASNIDEELLRYGLGPASERRRLASLQGRARILITQSSVEFSAAASLRDRISSIRNGMNRIARIQNKALKVLDQWEPTIDGGEDVVRQALVNVKEVVKTLCDERMEISWLRETVSRLPFGIKPRLGLVNIEKEIIALSESHVSLSNRAEDLLALILSRLHLWDNYGVKLETVRTTVREADYMMELLRIDAGPIDLPRIVKASTRLQGVKESLIEREGGLEELRTAEERLEAVVRAEVGERLRAEVREEEAAWARAEAGLGELASSYRKAADLWSRYREALSAADLPPLLSSLTLEVSLSA
ncbi:unnamed protein product [Nezara viridula]|uniref:KASH domain-containing protein n=1 Tax=Nezara viridula TaxID=85310 RepID=A0A9P0HK80_NEZVI|nr:unnamed protein product [Nezara viridula]